MKKIVIDCRYLGMSGIGRVLEGYLQNISFSSEYEFYYWGNPNKLSKYGIEKNIISNDESPVSKNGLFIDKTINKYDLFFTPNFIIPYGLKIPAYTMIHDLMFLDYKDSTNNLIDKIIKMHFYKRCIHLSKKIFTVSEFTKSRIKYHFPKCKTEIITIYNGLSKSIIEYKKSNKKIEKENYIIYVGNIKKHKGLSVLLNAVEKTDYKVYLVGEYSNFRTKDNIIEKYVKNENVCFTGKVNDDVLFDYISKAKFLVQPSFYEGFGIPPLEALFLQTKPIISDIEVFKEIYTGLDVEFFKKGNSEDLLKKLEETDCNVSQLRTEVLEKYSYKHAFEKIINCMIK